ncbi:MAG: ArsR family transcriptional regulator [Verrucomicrobiota bacterium]
MEGFLKELTGSKTAEWCLLHLFHYGETYGRAVADDLPVSLLNVQRQLEKLEISGVLVSTLKGRTRVYSWNPKSPFTKPLKEMVRIQYESLAVEKRVQLFSKRRRPRRKNKPVLRT